MTVESVDVVLPVKNRREKLPKCLSSLVSEVDISKLIVVDGYSSDGSVEYLKDFASENDFKLDFVRSNASLGRAREIGAKQVESDWFLFLDSDVYIQQGYFDIFKECVNSEIGAFQGRGASNTTQNNTEYILDRVGRAWTHATFVRKEAVRGLEIPEWLEKYEDEFIRRHVESQGFKWYFSYSATFGTDWGGGVQFSEFKEGKILGRLGYKSAALDSMPLIGSKHPDSLKMLLGYVAGSIRRLSDKKRSDDDYEDFHSEALVPRENEVIN